MTFEEELGAAFNEVAGISAPQIFLTNGKFTGTISRSTGSSPLTEPGYEDMDGITIAVPVAQFDTKPDATLREVVTVRGGPFDGKWTFVGLQADAGHYYLTCVPLE